MLGNSTLHRTGAGPSSVLAAAMAAFAIATSLVAAAPRARSEPPTVPCEEAGFATEGPRSLMECRYDRGHVRGTESGHALAVSLATGYGLDVSAGGIFVLVRIDAGRRATISDADVAEFVSWYLFDGPADLLSEAGFGEFEVASGERRFGDGAPMPCYVFLRQWGYGLTSGYKHQLGGLYCGSDALPDRGALEDFLTTTRYEVE